MLPTCRQSVAEFSRTSQKVEWAWPGLEQAVPANSGLTEICVLPDFVRRFVDWCLGDAKYALYVVDNNENNLCTLFLSHSASSRM